MKEEKTKVGTCEDEACKTCDNKECPESPAYIEHEPSVLKFMVNHTLEMVTHIFAGFINILKDIGILFSAPWGIPYAGLIFNEMQKMYFEKVKEKNIPYFRPPSFMMKDAIIRVSHNRSLKRGIAARIRKDNGGTIIFYIRMFLTPFHYTGKCAKDKTAFVKETMKYNESFHDEFKNKSGELDSEKIQKITLEIMELFAKTFIIKGQHNEKI